MVRGIRVTSTCYPQPARKGSEIATCATAALAALRSENYEGSTAVCKGDLLAIRVESILYVLKIRISIRGYWILNGPYKNEKGRQAAVRPSMSILEGTIVPILIHM